MLVLVCIGCYGWYTATQLSADRHIRGRLSQENTTLAAQPATSALQDSLKDYDGEFLKLTRSNATRTQHKPRLGKLMRRTLAPRLTIEPYVPLELTMRMKALRPDILAAASRHNIFELSGMTDSEFAEVMAVLLYNEHNGWLEDEVEALRSFTPLYEDLQVRANESGMGYNFSVRPANLRPSVALEILRQELPIPGMTPPLTVPVTVTGSRIDPDTYTSYTDLLADITIEIRQDDMAIEYLAANLARGLYRAKIEGVTVSWRTLAAWHNQGIVDPIAIRTNPTARDYVRRASAYLPLARRFITEPVVVRYPPAMQVIR